MDGGAGNGWFRVSRLEPGVWAIEEPLHAERVASYLIAGRERAVLLDTGLGVAPLRPLVEALTDRPLTVLLSHAHYDHVGGTHEFVRAAPVLIHPAEADRLRRGVANERLRRSFAPELLSGPTPPGFDPETAAIPGVEPSGALADGQTLDLGDRSLEVIHCPGHAPGLVAVLDRERRSLYSTDVVYAGPLYAHVPGADLAAYVQTAARLAALAPDLDRLYPAHDQRPLRPDFLPRVAEAFAAIVAGRTPDGNQADADIYHDEGFSILLAPAATGGGA